MTAKKKDEPSYWSTTAGKKHTSGGSWGVQDSYARRNQRKKANGRGCVVVLLVGASLLAGPAYLIQAGWVL